MKRLSTIMLCVLLAVAIIFTFVACNDGQTDNNPPTDYTRPVNPNIDTAFTADSNILVAYFSKTNTTRGVAEKIRELTGADIFEIERKEAYPASYTPTTEEAKDEKDANARPELKTYLPDDVIAQYDTIILGFPIWWHTAPMPVLSFLNYYNLSGKTIITFCTSGGSSIVESTADIISNSADASVIEGRRFSGGNDSAIESWLNSLNLLDNTDDDTIQNPDDNDNSNDNSGEETPDLKPDNPSDDTDESGEKKVLIAYFSWSGTTTRLVNHIKEQIPNATLFEIERVTPYSDDYNTVAYGEAKEEADNNARPPIKNPLTADEMSEYDVIILAYPIWWHTAPMVVGTFLETYNLSGVDIYPITQSASMSTSQFNESFDFVKTCAKNATVHDGLGTKSTSIIDAYLRENGLID